MFRFCRTAPGRAARFRAGLMLGGALALGACAFDQAVRPPFAVLPAQGKDLAAFQQDDLICQQHAVAHTGYSGRAQPSPSASAVAPPDRTDADPTAYLQCMAARGDTIKPVPPPAVPAANIYGYPYASGYPYTVYDGGFFGGVGWGFGGGWNHGRWRHGGLHHGWGGGRVGGGHR